MGEGSAGGPRGDFVASVHATGRDALVEVRGEVDAYTAPEFGERLDEAIRLVEGRVFVDLAGLRFVESAGVSALVRANKCLRELGRELVLRSPPPATRKVLEISGVASLIRIED